MQNLPTHTPTELLQISPEALEVANQYLQLQSVEAVADSLDLSTQQCSQILARREVRAYIDQVFFDLGFNNRFRIRNALDAVIRKKFQDLEEADTGSSKDIADLLALSHKFTMEQLDKQIELEKVHHQNIKSQVNVQINEAGGGSKYGALIQQLVTLDAQKP